MSAQTSPLRGRQGGEDEVSDPSATLRSRLEVGEPGAPAAAASLVDAVALLNAMLCNLGLGAVTMDGRLHLTFRYPHRLFGPDAARRFAECYLRQVRLVAESRS